MYITAVCRYEGAAFSGWKGLLTCWRRRWRHLLQVWALSRTQHGGGLVGKKATYFSNSNLISCIGQQPMLRYVRLLTGVSANCWIIHTIPINSSSHRNATQWKRRNIDTWNYVNATRKTVIGQQKKTLKITKAYSILRVHSAVILPSYI